jgi:RNA polymerase sigma-32 factor
VVKIASKYINTGLILSDLVQEGTVGLMKAVKNFNPYHGVRLASFAIHWIKSEIHEFILKNWSLVKIATTKAQRKVFFNINKFKKKQKFFSCDEIKEIADFLNVSEKDVSNMAQRMSHKGDMYSDELESADIVLEDTTSNHALLLEQQNLLDFKKTSISNAVAKLDPRSQTIIKERWLNEDNKSSLKDLANKFNISLVRIGQIEKQALKALKESLSSRD